ARLTHNSRARVPCLAFTPDGKTLAAVVSNKITLWDLATSKSNLTLPGGAHRITFSTDGKTLLASSQRSATLWDVATGVKEAHFPAQTWSYFTDIALAPDGKTLAQGTQDGIVLRDRATHKEIR